MLYFRFSLIFVLSAFALIAPARAEIDPCATLIQAFDQSVTDGKTYVRPEVESKQLHEALCLLLEAQIDAKNTKRDLFYDIVFHVHGKMETFDWSPRTALLMLDFDDLYHVQIGEKAQGVWQAQTEFAFAPDGPSRPYLKVTVTPYMNGKLTRLYIISRLPAPAPVFPPPPPEND